MPFTPKFVDLVRNFATVQGTGQVTVNSAVSGFSSLADALSTGDQFYYCLQSVDKPQEREVGRGTLQADGKVAREPVSGAPTNFTGGTKTIALVAAAEWFAKLDEAASAGTSIEAAARAELAESTPGRGPALLTEDGRGGLFAFDPSDLSALVAADTKQGIHVPPASDPSGASGAWVRKFDGAVSVKWFGATGDGATDDSAAFVAALTYLKGIAVNGDAFYEASPRLFVPAGHYYLGTTTLDISHTLIIEGEGTGLAGGIASKLRWAAGATGIRIQRFNTTGAGTVVAGSQIAGDATVIRGLYLLGGYTSSEGEYHGIHLKARAAIEECQINGFEGDGIYIRAFAGAGNANEGNANGFAVNRVRCVNNRNGIYIDGDDANAGTVYQADCSSNRQWGIWDSSFLGNTHTGCHVADNGVSAGGSPSACVSYGGSRYGVIDGQAAGASTNAPTATTADNTWWYYIGAGGVHPNFPAWVSGTTYREGGAYKTDNANANNLFVGCYSESGQGFAQCVSPTLFIGGSLSGIRGTGNRLGASQDGMLASTVKGGAIGARDGNDRFALRPTSLETNSAAGYGTISLQWFNKMLALSFYGSGLPNNHAFQINGDTTTANVGARRLNFPNGFGINDKKVLSGTAAPASGTYVQGDMMFNSAPTAANPMGWMCVTGGSPGTWKALGSLAA